MNGELRQGNGLLAKTEQGSDWPRVGVVILNWNGEEETIQCVTSLRKASYPSLEIIVVDNNSRATSRSRLSDFLKVESGEILLENDENLGFSRGCNVGLRHARALGCHYFLLLNNDCTVAPGFLEPAIQIAERDSTVGLVGGKIALAGEEHLLWYAGGHVDLWRGQAVVRGFRQPDGASFSQITETAFVTGAMMLIPARVIQRVGFLPEEYFFGVEEWDYSLTVRRAGYRLLYVPEFTAVHKSDGSHSNSDPKYIYNAYRNKLIFQQKFLPAPLYHAWLLLFALYAFAVARFRLRSLHASLPVRATQFAIRRAFVDHLFSHSKLDAQQLQAFETELQNHISA